MQINNNGITNNTNSSGANGAKAATEKGSDRPNAGGGGSQSDSVELSSQALVLTDLETKINSANAIDSSKVEQLKAAINSGEYTIDADKVAARLLASDDLF